tara:strand:- start:4 stop:426 length:423 start_codon:yes stop_codon:yes gene_type:complete
MKKLTKVPTWSKKFETGISEVDLQHQFFLKLIFQFYQRTIDTTNSSYIDHYIEELCLYAKFHFCSEENLMLRAGYKGLKNHRMLHAELIEDLTNKVNLLKIQETNLDAFLEFLTKWFLDHTLIEDKKFADFVDTLKNSKN